MDLFGTLGFRWDRPAADAALPVLGRDVACFDFHKNMASFVWDASVLEGNPCTLPQVQTLMSGVTVGGLRVADQRQVLGLIEACQTLHTLVKADRFVFDRPTSLLLHDRIARDEALEWGVFRGEGRERHYTPNVALGVAGIHTPPATQPGGKNLIDLFEQGRQALVRECRNPFEKAAAFSLFGALQQFFFDGNKRTARLMMNGILMSQGIRSLSVPADKLQIFNECMVRFYVGKDGSEMIDFLRACHISLR